jgi:hypothetical protein
MRKALLIGSVVVGALLLRPLFAQDPTTELLTIPVNGSVVKDGQTYSFSGNVTFPRPKPAVLPPYPSFHGPLDANGNYIRTAKPGDVVTLAGRDFGTAMGKVFFGTTVVYIIEWTDTAIRFELPPIPAGKAPHGGHLIAIHRADGAAVAVLSFDLYR